MTSKLLWLVGGGGQCQIINDSEIYSANENIRCQKNKNNQDDSNNHNYSNYAPANTAFSSRTFLVAKLTIWNSLLVRHSAETFLAFNSRLTRSSATAEIARDADVGAHSLSL